MSYDIWLVPADQCTSAAAARGHALNQDATEAPTTPPAEELADAITAANEQFDEESGFLSMIPLEATGDVVFVPSPWGQIQRARDIAIPTAFAAGFGVYDPQLDLVLDPRSAVDGVTMTSREGTFGTITPTLITHFVQAMDIDDFIIVETGEEMYIQSKRVDADVFLLEYRDGSADRHFGTELTTPDEVAAAIRGWAVGETDAYRGLDWSTVDLSQDG